jgi:hypothetical protein
MEFHRLNMVVENVNLMMKMISLSIVFNSKKLKSFNVIHPKVRLRFNTNKIVL